MKVYKLILKNIEANPLLKPDSVRNNDNDKK